MSASGVVAGGAPPPLASGRVAAWFAARDLQHTPTDSGAVVAMWDGKVFTVRILGQAQILQVWSSWHRTFAIEWLPRLRVLCNDLNSQQLWPKAWVEVEDDGMVRIACSAATDLAQGVTDDQLDELLHVGLSYGHAFLSFLDATFPDPVTAAP